MVLKKMLEQEPCNGDAWYLLGLEYLDAGHHSLALESFSQALKFCDEELKLKIFNNLGKLTSQQDIISVESELHVSERLEEGNNFYNADYDVSEYVNENNESKTGELKDNLIRLSIVQGGRVERLDSDTVSVVDFSDVGGLDELKRIIEMKIVKPFLNRGLFDKFNKKVGGGILLFGPPGCGKTFIARATAGECNARFIPVHITDVLDPFLGVSARNIKDIFSSARAKKPCILFFDEVDTIGYNRSKLSSEHMRPIVDQMLSEIEGIDTSTDKMLIIGATNMPWDVDAAFKRPGRFDKTVFVPPPDLKARAQIFKLKLKDKPVENLDYDRLAQLTELYSGADIENVVEVATETVINEILMTDIERKLMMEDLIAAINNTHPSTIEWLRTIRNYVKYANQAGLYDDVEKYISAHRHILG